jgi:hypothetical protein
LESESCCFWLPAPCPRSQLHALLVRRHGVEPHRKVNKTSQVYRTFTPFESSSGPGGIRTHTSLIKSQVCSRYTTEPISPRVYAFAKTNRRHPFLLFYVLFPYLSDS